MSSGGATSVPQTKMTDWASTRISWLFKVDYVGNLPERLRETKQKRVPQKESEMAC
jgi:hypothetical protein